jgi:hypothetical protein
MATKNYGIGYVPEGTLDPAAGLNAALHQIDGRIVAKVLAMDLTAPPGSPADGDAYIVSSPATGSWTGHEDDLAQYVDEGSAWEFTAPELVGLALNGDDGGLYRYDALSSDAGWVLAAGLQDAPSDGTGYVRKDGAWEPESGGGGGGAAEDITYDNTDSDLVATEVQAALDEIVAYRPRPNVDRIQLIHDTDIGDDCDDIGAFAMMHRLADLGEVDILACGAANGHVYQPKIISCLNTFYGRPDIPIGQNLDTPIFANDDSYGTFLSDYPNAIDDDTVIEEAYKLYRRVLASAQDGSVTIMFQGQLSNLYQLFNSVADEYSPLNGEELIRLKHRELVLLAGAFNASSPSTGTEHDLISEPAGAQVVNQLPDDFNVTYSGYNLGFDVLTLSNQPAYSPVKAGYDYFLANYPGGPYANRASWGALCMLYAARGLVSDGITFAERSALGKMAVDVDGDNTFTYGGSGKIQSWLARPAATSAATIAAHIQAMQDELPKRGAGEFLRYTSTGIEFDGADLGSGSAGNAVTALPISTGAVTVDCSLGNYFTLALSANVTSIGFTGLPGSGKGATIGVRIAQGASYSVAWPANFYWLTGTAPTVSTTAGAVDVLSLQTFDNGATWIAALAKDYRAGGVLDPYTTSLWSAGGITRLLSSYSGSLIRVRRSSDNAEQDIGYAAGGALDTTALASFVGANSAFVTTLYDQTGNSRHWVQATSGLQPRIVNAGVYDGFARFDGADDTMACATTFGASPGMTCAIRYEQRSAPSAATYPPVFSMSNPNVAAHQTVFFSSNPDTSVKNDLYLFNGVISGSNFTVENYAFSTSEKVDVASFNTAVAGTGQIRLFRSGVELTATSTTNNYASGNSLTAETLHVGSYPGNGSVTNPMNLKTIAVWSAEKGADGAGISGAL